MDAATFKGLVQICKKKKTRGAKTFSLRGPKLKLNNGPRAKSKRLLYCSVLLRCKMMLYGSPEKQKF